MFARSAVLLLLACAVPTPVIDKEDPDPCASVDCDGHGSCAVEGGTTAICLCQAGYRAEGVHCEAVVAGNECQGVTCSSHGTCVVVDGSPKAPLCLCNTGFHSAGATTCVADPGDPCAGQLCSGHGTCAVANGTTAVCVCESGYSATGLSCLAPSVFDGGPSGLLLVPTSLAWSRTGKYASFTTISTSDGGSTVFDLGSLVLRDLQAGTERVLDAQPAIFCGPGGCALANTVIFDDRDQRALITSTKSSSGMASYSPGQVLELSSGSMAPVTSLGWLERPLQYSPDLSWAVVGRQTYLGAGGGWALLPSLTGSLQNIAASCTDAAASAVDAVSADGGTVRVAYWSCVRVTNTTVTWTLSVTTMPGHSTTVVTAIPDATFTKFLTTYQAGGYVWYTASGTSSYVAIAPSATPVSLGTGELGNRSPNGRFAVFVEASGSSLVDLLDPSTPKVTLGTLKRSDWRAPDTLIFKKTDGSVWSTTTGAAPVQLVASGLVSDTFSATAHGLVDNVLTGISQLTVTVRNPTATMVFGVPSDSRRTFYSDQGSAQDLGAWAYWSNGPSMSLRGRFYFDVLRGSVPDPSNGFSFVTVP